MVPIARTNVGCMVMCNHFFAEFPQMDPAVVFTVFSQTLALPEVAHDKFEYIVDLSVMLYCLYLTGFVAMSL